MAVMIVTLFFIWQLSFSGMRQKIPKHDDDDDDDDNALYHDPSLDTV
jgi:hypothetical protein